MAKPLNRALVLAALYWLLGTSWILASDLIVERLAGSLAGVTGAQTWKGIGFVTVTAALFCVAIYRELERSSWARRSEELKAHVVDEISDAVIATDFRGDLLLFNRAAERMFGWSPEELGRREIAALLPPPLRDRLGRLEELSAGGRWRGEFLAPRKDGSSLPVYAVSSPIQERDGRVRGVLLVATDVSAEKAAARALEEGEARYRALIEGSSDIITILDDDGSVRYVSAAHERILGRPVSPEPGAGVADALFVHPDDREDFERAVRQLMVSPGRALTFEARLGHVDGSWVAMKHHGRNHVDHPALRGVVINSRDVSTQQDLERQLRQAQKMEAIGRLAGGVAHDFNNIVTGIMGHAQLLLTDLEEGTSAEADVREIRAAAERAGALTRQLLAFSRQQILRPEIVDLNVVVSSLRGMLERLLEESIELVTDLQGDLHPVRVDGGQVDQVIMNLVVNARDAIPANGTVTIRTRNVDLTDEDTREFPFEMPAGPFVTLSVVDDGEGIPQRIRDRVFEPFFTTKEVGKGTGLGLSMVYGIVKQSGGFIRLISELGEGSTFIVYLPRAEGVAVGRRVPSDGDIRPGTETLLVVEDDDAIRRVMVRTLQRWGYTVLEARDGLEGLGVLRAEPSVELLITDIVMPRMGGREMVDAARAEGWKGEVLFVSGYASRGDTRTSFDGGSELLQKPYTPRDLGLRVRALLDGASGG